MNYKHNANGLPFTISNHNKISQQDSNFESLWQTIFLKCYAVDVRIL